MRLPARTLTAVALCAAVLAVSAWICVPSPVPFTLQSAAVCFAARLLGGKSVAAVGVYLAAGAVGAPVFAGGGSGFGVLTGPTGGLLWGFILMAALIGLLRERVPAGAGAAAGLAVCYLCGTAWFCAVSGGTPTAAILTCVLPYIIPDALGCALACTAARRVGREVLR